LGVSCRVVLPSVAFHACRVMRVGNVLRVMRKNYQAA
jgi:hypothetical protein